MKERYDHREQAEAAMSDYRDSIVEMIHSHLVGAIQFEWDEWLGDTGCIPCCFKIHGPRTTRLSAEFDGSAFIKNVADRLLYNIENKKDLEIGYGWEADDE